MPETIDPRRSGLLSYSERMAGLFRTVVIWLLALALPAQGMAAATMALCDPNHHRLAIVSPSVEPGPVESGRPAPCHPREHGVVGAAAGAEPSAQAQELPAGEVPAATWVQADPHQCSACAACCSAAAIGNDVVVLPAAAASSTPVTSLVPGVERFASGGPDRPPRPLFD